MLVPVITSTGMPASSSTCNTPMWASPRAAPPESATPTFWAWAGCHGNAHARSTKANRFTVGPFRGVEGLQTVAFARQSGAGQGERDEARDMQRLREGSTLSLEGHARHDPPAKL